MTGSAFGAAPHIRQGPPGLLPAARCPAQPPESGLGAGHPAMPAAVSAARRRPAWARRVWDTRTLQLVRTVDTAAPVTDIELSPDGRFLTTAAGNAVQLWDAVTFAPSRTFVMATPVSSASLCPARGRFSAGGADMWPRMFDLASGAELGTSWALLSPCSLPSCLRRLLLWLLLRPHCMGQTSSRT